MRNPKQMAELLAQKLNSQELLELQMMMDGDSYDLWEAVTEIAMKVDPKSFGNLDEYELGTD